MYLQNPKVSGHQIQLVSLLSPQLMCPHLFCISIGKKQKSPHILNIYTCSIGIRNEKFTYIIDIYRYQKRRSPHLLWINIGIRNESPHILLIYRYQKRRSPYLLWIHLLWINIGIRNGKVHT